jgi:pyruvate ferredoxin oxidoreductase alpha subunit
MLPVMVCMDGWVLTHSYERVTYVDQAEVDKFLPPFRPEHFLDPADPKSWGSYAEADVMMEFKYAIYKAMVAQKPRIKAILAEVSELTGRDNSGLIEAYRTAGADVILVAVGSVTGTIKDAVDDMRSAGKNVGLVKIRCYRPFPHEEILQAVKDARVVAVMDANVSMGSEGAIGLDLKAKLCGRPGAPLVIDFIAGLGGREINAGTIGRLVNRAEEIARSGQPLPEPEWVDLNPAILP